MPDDNKPTEVGELTDEQLDAALEGADFGLDDDQLGNDLEIGEPDPKDSEGDGEEKTDDESEDSEDADDESEEESDSEDTDEESEEDASDESDEEQDDDDETSEMDPDMRAQITSVLETVEMLKAQNERLQSEVERERLLRDRNAGKLGSLMQKLKKGSADDDADADLDDDSDDADERRSKSKDPEVSEELQEIRVERVSRAIEGVSQEFLSVNSEFFNALEAEAGTEAAKEFHAGLVAKIQEGQENLGEDIFTMSPKLAAKVAKTIIASAFADVKLELMREYQKRAAEKSEESRRQIRARKKGAAGARSNKRAAAAKPKDRSLSKMSDAELEAALASASFDE